MNQDSSEVCMIHIRSLATVGLFSALTACGASTPAPEAQTSQAPAESPAPPAAEAPTKAETTVSQTPTSPEPAKAEPAKQEPIEVKVEPRSGSKLSGTIRLEPVDGGVKVTLMVENAPPGHHGAHIHQKADCSAPDGKSAGDHFNPAGHQHGLPPGAERHLGDLGNLDVGKNGQGKIEIVIQGANLLAGDPSSFLDRAVIVHEKKDDGGQPTGNAGGRIGCGEIKR